MDSAARLTPDALLAHEAFVLRLARSLVRDEATARDLAQETWLSALEHPPRQGSLRGWLARVTRNHAINLTRGRGRREARERAAARHEALEAGATSAERLELQHGVVRAVLALDEPYRSVVIGVYYEGRSPGDLARALGVPASTVRAQLSRGLERLRVQLDGEHGGDRGAWCAALVGWLRREGSLGSATAGANGITAWIGAVALTLAAAVGWQVHASRTRTVRSPALAAAPDGSREAGTEAAGGDEARSAVALSGQGTGVGAVAPDESDPAAELRDLNERALWLKDRIVARRTAIAPALASAYAWFERRPDTGLVRLFDAQLAGVRFELPWLAGGGSTWSFGERTLDAARHGQLRLEQQGLGVPTTGGGKGVVVDLGPGDLRGFVADLPGALAGLDDDARAAWEIAARPLDVRPDMEKLELQRALRNLKRDDEVEPETGHVYLVRAFRPRAFDVLALVEVADVDPRTCALAWWLVESRPVEDAVPAPLARDAERAALAPRPEYEALDEGALLAELGRIEERLSERLDASKRGPQRLAGGVEHATLIDRSSPHARAHAPEAEPWLFSFATRRHGARSRQDIALEDGDYSMEFNARSISWFLDLGAIELEDAEHVAAGRFADAWSLMSGAALPHFAPQPERIEAQLALQRRAAGIGLTDRVPGRVGHTYLVRSIFPTWHDRLVAFRLEERRPTGDRLAWRALAAWAVDAR